MNNHPLNLHTHDRRLPLGAGFTLMEVVISMAVTSILFVAIGSAIVVASSAIPDKSDARAQQLAVWETVQTMAEEIETAVNFTARTASALEFSVADRSGDGVDETIRYEWSGAAGQPLTRRYNNGAAVTVVDNVQVFELAYSTRPFERTPRLMLVVPDASNLSAQDAAKRATIASWGYQVTPITASASQASFDAAVTSVDVAYISEETFSTDLNTKLTGKSIGVLNEEGSLYDEFAISAAGSFYQDHAIDITDNTHDITSGFPTGHLTICTSVQQLTVTGGTVAGGAQTLAERVASSSRVFVIVEAGGALTGGATAAGRRVMMPWGGSEFDFNSLNTNALRLMKNSIDWAAGSSVLTRVRITLGTSTDGSGSAETEVDVLNRPGVAGP